MNVQSAPIRTGITIAGTLAFEAVHHDYDGVKAVRGVDLEINAGEVLCVLGESGCGKTTLLRLAAGIERPRSGRILLDGLEIAGPKRFREPEKRGIGMMFQDNALFPHLTVLENVMFGLSSLKRKDQAEEARRYLARVGLSDFATVHPHMLSGGQQQRVALARALAPRPRVLLMDEPFSGLDRGLRTGLRDDILTICRAANITTILVTHDPEEAMVLGDRVALMRHGKLAQIGTPRELYNHPVCSFTARFLSDLLEIRTTVNAGTVETPFGRLPALGWPDGKAVIAGIRPSGLLIAGAEPGGVASPAARGRVINKVFGGEMDIVTVVLNGIEKPFKIRIRDADAMTIGDEVQLNLDPRQLVIVPQDTI